MVLASHCVFLLFVDPQCKLELRRSGEEKISNNEILLVCGGHIYLYIYVSVYLCICLFLYICIYISTYISISIYLHIYISLF